MRKIKEVLRLKWEKDFSGAACQVVRAPGDGFPGLADEGVVGPIRPLATDGSATIDQHEEPSRRTRREHEGPVRLGHGAQLLLRAIDADCDARERTVDRIRRPLRTRCQL